MIRKRRGMVDTESARRGGSGALLKNLTDYELQSTSHPPENQSPLCTGFYGGNSLGKAMPRRTKLCYGCRLGTIVNPETAKHLDGLARGRQARSESPQAPQAWHRAPARLPGRAVHRHWSLLTAMSGARRPPHDSPPSPGPSPNRWSF
jgi:hypothetical protein